MDEMTNLTLAANAIIHPYHIPGKELLSPKYATKYVYVEEGVGMKVIHNGHAIFVRTERDAKNGPHIQFSILVDNSTGESKWLPVGFGKIKDGVAVLDQLEVDKPAARYKISKETWELYKEMMADTMKMLILYASICRIRYGLPTFSINHYSTKETIYTAILPEDEPKKDTTKVEYAKTVEKTEADSLKELVESLKKLSEEVKSLKEAQKNADSEANYQKWQKEVNEFIMEVVKTREIPVKNDENTLKCADIFVRLNKAVREFCAEAYSLCAKSSNNISFTETINATCDISDERFTKLLPIHRAEEYILARYKNELLPNKYKISCIIASEFTGAVKYIFKFSDSVIYKNGIGITFQFNKDMELVNVKNTMNEFSYLKLHPVFQYISQFNAGNGVHLTHKIAHLCGDIQKKINAEEKENGKEGK